MEKLGLMILCQAFSPCLKPNPADMLDFHIPVTVAWIRIPGENSAIGL